jgi:hypothetical protein
VQAGVILFGVAAGTMLASELHLRWPQARNPLSPKACGKSGGYARATAARWCSVEEIQSVAGIVYEVDADSLVD